MNPRAWFWDLGIHVFPTFDKVPAVPKGTSQFDYRCTREQASHFKEYGVPLGALAVADTDTPETEAWALVHLPPTPFKVHTARGTHRYYRLIWDAPHFFHRDTFTIECRHKGQYVIGPGSVRPNGVVYRPDNWSWQITDIPFFPVGFLFDDGSCGVFSAAGEPYEFPNVVSAGRRHDELFRLLRSCKGKGWDLEETRSLITTANVERCNPPLTENTQFEQWFMRQWNKPDTPWSPPEIPNVPLEPNTIDYDLDADPATDIDLDTPGGDL